MRLHTKECIKNYLWFTGACVCPETSSIQNLRSTCFVIEDGVEGEGVYTLAVCRTREDAEGILALLGGPPLEVEERVFDTPESFRRSLV